RELYEALSRGEFCYVLTARQMGKSSLMVRTAAKLREQGVRVAVLDLTAVGQNLAPEQWYGGLLRRLGRQLDPGGDLEDTLDDFWDDQQRLGPLQRFMEALRTIVLERVQGCVPSGRFRVQDSPLLNPEPRTPNPRLVIFIDE